MLTTVRQKPWQKTQLWGLYKTQDGSPTTRMRKKVGLMKNLAKRVKRKFFGPGKDPFGNAPRGEPADYLQLFLEAKGYSFPEIDVLEQSAGHAAEPDWLNELALHTQVVMKRSKLNWQHGRLLYSFLSQFIRSDASRERFGEAFTIFETGTARGFSSICMAKALIDAEVPGSIVTLDTLPHDYPMFWNCIDDHEGKKSRQNLLSQWPAETARIIFLQGTSRTVMPRLGLARIQFAFLDAQHTLGDVLTEYRYVRDRQLPGDIIFFDDVTPGHFDGVVDAVQSIESEGLYNISRLEASPERGYALAVRRLRGHDVPPQKGSSWG